MSTLDQYTFANDNDNIVVKEGATVVFEGSGKQSAQLPGGNFDFSRTHDTELASGHVDGPSMLALSDNGHVLAWSSENADFKGIVVNRYSATGELLQHTEIASEEVDDPSLTELPNGQFILAWTSENDASGISTVYTQLFSAAGSKLGNPVKIASAGYELEDAKVTVLANNKYIVTWGETHDGDNFQAPSFANLKGVVVTNGKAAPAQTLLTGNVDEGEADDVAIFTVAGSTNNSSTQWLTYTLEKPEYDSFGQLISNSTTLRITQISADGKPLGTPQDLNQVTSAYLNATYFDVIQTDSGFLVSWVDQGGVGGMQRVIYTQQYDKQFQAQGARGEVVSAESINGASAFASPEGYVLAWNEYAVGGAKVYLQRFNADGSPIDNAPILVGQAAENQTLWDAPAISVRGDGTLLVSWEVSANNVNSDGANSVLHLQQVNAEGKLVGTINTVIHGDAQDNTLHWAGSDDVILDGDAGNDTAQLDGNLADFSFATDAVGNITVKGQQTTGLVDIEQVRFDDATVTVDSGRFANERGTAISMEPASTTLSDGGYVIVWEQDGKIHRQQYDQQQDLVKNDLLDGVTGSNPIVSAGKDGSYLIGWASGSYELVIQAYDSTGQLDGAAVTVHTQNSANPMVYMDGASVTVLSNGTWVVSWSEELRDAQVDQNGITHYQEGAELFLQLVDPVSHALIGTPQKVDKGTVDNAIYASEPSVNALPGGGFVVVWEREYDATDDVDIYMQRYDANGNPLGANVRVNTSTAGEQIGGDVAVLTDGSYVVAWTSMKFDKDENPVSGNVFMQRYSATGTKLGGETPVNVASKEIQGEPAITALSGGGYVISWATSDEAAHSGPANLYAQVYDKNGVKVGSQMLITSDSSNDLFPVVAATADGGFIVTWESLSHARGPNGQNLSGDIYSQRFDANGNSAQLAGDQGDNTLTWSGTGGVTLRGEDGDDQLQGGSGNDLLIGGAGNDLLDGGAGVDTLVGGTGDDTYVVDSLKDVIVENSDEGTDTVRASLSWTLGANLENLKLTGTAAINGTGNAGDNFLLGNSGRNTLNGGAGNDTLDGAGGIDSLVGGTGDDTYAGDLLVKGAGKQATLALEDSITELANQGNDTLVLRMDANALANFQGSASITLGANLENLDAHLLGTLGISLIGNAGNNEIRGNAGDNLLDGKAGIDSLRGGDGNDTYVLDDAAELLLLKEFESEGNDTLQITYRNLSKTEAQLIDLNIASLANVENVTVTGTGLFDITGNAADNLLTGNTARNVLLGGDGNDTLNGKGGGDQLEGGDGDDTYYVYSDKDVVVENLGAGTDTVRVVSYAKNSYLLADNIENAIVDSTAAINLTGNGLANTLIGNAAANILDGGLGADTLQGGKGNDTYIVDDANDEVVELANEGIDTVKSSVDHSLDDNVENLILLAGATSGTGNTLRNSITGNAADNVLDGGKEVDTLAGGAGNDRYIVDLLSKGLGTKATVALEDTVIELANQGTDTLELRMGANDIASFKGSASITLGANLENLDASKLGELDIKLIGNLANNEIWGSNGNNELNGGAGNDILHAGDGGTNVLIGGLGTDIMHGGTGKDIFKFNALNEMGLNEKQDVIIGFGANDKLDLSALKGYSFVGLDAFTGAKQLRYAVEGGDIVVYGNSNADGAPDFSIKLQGITTLSPDQLTL